MEKKPTRLHGVYKSDGCESGCSRNLTRKTRKEAEISSARVLHPVSRPRPPSRVFLRTGSGSRGRTEGPCVPQPDLFSSLATAQNTKPERWELGSVCVCVCPRRSRDTDPATLGPACLGLGRRRAPGSGLRRGDAQSVGACFQVGSAQVPWQPRLSHQSPSGLPVLVGVHAKPLLPPPPARASQTRRYPAWVRRTVPGPRPALAEEPAFWPLQRQRRAFTGNGSLVVLQAPSRGCPCGRHRRSTGAASVTEPGDPRNAGWLSSPGGTAVPVAPSCREEGTSLLPQLVGPRAGAARASPARRWLHRKKAGAEPGSRPGP